MPEQRDLNAPIGAASPAGATGSWWLLGVRMSSSSADAIAAACTTPHGQGARLALVACVNVHSLAVASRDGQFSAALDAATYVTADGAPVRAAGRLLRETVGPRVTGYDVFERAMTRLDGRGGSG